MVLFFIDLATRWVEIANWTNSAGDNEWTTLKNGLKRTLLS
jgi:hypothetical protein